jgi:hypothetical protein
METGNLKLETGEPPRRSARLTPAEWDRWDDLEAIDRELTEAENREFHALAEKLEGLPHA